MKKQTLSFMIIILMCYTSLNAKETLTCINHMKAGLTLQTQKSPQELAKDRHLLRNIETHYNNALLTCPEMCESHPHMCYNLGLVYQIQDKTDLAETMFQKALIHNPKMDEASFQLASIYEKKQLYAIAMKHYLNAMDINPKNENAIQHAKSIAMNHQCEGIGVKNNTTLSEVQLYNAFACKQIFSRAQKRFGLTRAVYVSPVDFWNIHFDIGSARIKQSAYPQLDKIHQMMGNHTDLKLMINGHTDDLPVNRRLEVLPNQFCWDNQCLSEYRALSVKNYLMKNGIEAERIQTRGFAAKRPYRPGERALNRRVEMLDLDYEK